MCRYPLVTGVLTGIVFGISMSLKTSYNAIASGIMLVFSKPFEVIVLNQQQLEAVTQINEFLKSEDCYFLLSGFTGTSKTTVLKKFSMNILKKL